MKKEEFSQKAEHFKPCLRRASFGPIHFFYKYLANVCSPAWKSAPELDAIFHMEDRQTCVICCLQVRICLEK